MSVRFDSNAYIRFSSPTAALNLTSKTYHCFVTGRSARTFFSGNDIFQISPGTSSVNTLRFEAFFSTTNGVWTASPPINATKITITYNGGATGNNPVIYADGVSLTVTRTAAPVGTYSTSATQIDLGHNGSVSNPLFLEDFRIYNVIKTAAQVAAIADEDIRTDQNIDESGLVFHAPLTMCRGLTYPTFVGATLSAANEFLDRVNGYVGVPSGSPVGA